jgi:hypothetical protein
MSYPPCASSGIGNYRQIIDPAMNFQWMPVNCIAMLVSRIPETHPELDKEDNPENLACSI